MYVVYRQVALLMAHVDYVLVLVTLGVFMSHVKLGNANDPSLVLL